MIKVTYYMYSYDTCCMIREMMGMNGLDSAKCQKSRKSDTLGIYGIVNDNETKYEECSSSSKRPKKMGSGWTGRDVVAGFLRFLEREREREHLLSRFPIDRTVDFRRSKK